MKKIHQQLEEAKQELQKHIEKYTCEIRLHHSLVLRVQTLEEIQRIKLAQRNWE